MSLYIMQYIVQERESKNALLCEKIIWRKISCVTSKVFFFTQSALSSLWLRYLILNCSSDLHETQSDPGLTHSRSKFDLRDFMCSHLWNKEMDNTFLAQQIFSSQCVADFPATVILPQAGPGQRVKNPDQAQDERIAHNLLEHQDFKGKTLKHGSPYPAPVRGKHSLENNDAISLCEVLNVCTSWEMYLTFHCTSRLNS